MTYTIDTKQLLTESAPVVAILLFWGVIAAILDSMGGGIRTAGLVMALLYVAVRGVTLARTTPASPQPAEVGDLVVENARVAIPAGLWFLLGAISVTLTRVVIHPVAEGLAFTLEALLGWVFVNTGLATVVLFAVIVGLSRLRDRVHEPTGTSTDVAHPAD